MFEYLDCLPSADTPYLYMHGWCRVQVIYMRKTLILTLSLTMVIVV
jgi:hypothetical protein